MTESSTGFALPAEPESSAPSVGRQTRPMYWSIRRELWENRSIYMAPLIVAAVVLFASAISTIGLPRKMRALPSLDTARQHAAVVKPFSLAPAPIMLASFLVGLFYSIDALYGERRDRSILFWKSMPVADHTTVLAKASIPIVVLPLIAFVLSVITFGLLLFLSTMVLLASGMSPVRLWAEVQFIEEPMIMLYGLTVHALWFAPVYAWFLLVSAWAKRAPLLWAVLPALAISALERIAFNSWSFMYMLQYRMTGAMREAFTLNHGKQEALERIGQLDPVRFLTAPGLWVGLLFAAACLTAAVRLRRYREPI